MGFPCICHTIILPRPLAVVLCILQRFFFGIAVALSYAGIQVTQQVPPAPSSLEAYRPAGAVPPITPAVIKSKLQVVELASFLARRSPTGCSLKEPTCVVCLGWLEAKDEIRELGNCSHAFHRACIDSWVDMGHVTCPLCRLQLLPDRTKKRAWTSITSLLPRPW